MWEVWFSHSEPYEEKRCLLRHAESAAELFACWVIFRAVLSSVDFFKN